MKILLEAHHPGDIHFWKYPVRELVDRGHEVRMLGRDRDVMRQLLQAYDWIPYTIPRRRSAKNKLPLVEMISRQWALRKEIFGFKPDVVASLFGSYCQISYLLGCKNIIFTDSEFQHFNHRIAHPFAHEIHTPYCFYKDLGRKQVFYQGIHEMAFLSPARFKPDASVLEKQHGLRPHDYIVVRLSAWNTLHDINQSGIGGQIDRFIEEHEGQYGIVICAEENALPPHLKRFAMQLPPEKFHDLLAYARFVLTEGASTASEAACLGVPTVYINSTEPRGYLQMLESDWGLMRNFETPGPGFACAREWLRQIDEETLFRYKKIREELFAAHGDVVDYLVSVLLKAADN